MNNLSRLSLINLCLIIIFFVAFPAQAAVKDWQKGISLYPESNNNFALTPFRESLNNANAIGANMATFIIPYYQTTQTSSDIQPGWNTPTDASLIAGIDYAHKLGMKVTLKIHLSSYNGDSWAATIHPDDKSAWFNAYGKLLTHYATFAQLHNVEQICIGNELTQLTSATVDPANTGYWQSLISQVRSIYSGELTYNANSDEKNQIAFWGNLDAIGVSAYFTVEQDAQKSWEAINQNHIAPLEEKFHKPILFTEVGYRSVDKAKTAPWNYTMPGKANQEEQASDYAALFNYWNNFDYMHGLNIWNWETNPDAGGPNDTHYTIQNKQAQNVVKEWFMRK